MQIVTLREDQGEKLIGLRVSIEAASYLETIINITEKGAFYFCTRKIQGTKEMVLPFLDYKQGQ